MQFGPLERLIVGNGGRLAVTGRIVVEDADFIRRHYRELRRFAAVVAPFDMDPDDVLHAVLVRMLRREGLSELRDPLAYLRRSIVNQIRSDIRRTQSLRRAVERLREPESSIDRYPSDVDDLMRLTPTERAVIYLHDVDGYSFEEVSDLLGMRSGRARMLASRARRRLRAEILGEEVCE